MPRVFLIHLVFIFRYFGGRRADGTQAASGSASPPSPSASGQPVEAYGRRRGRAGTRQPQRHVRTIHSRRRQKDGTRPTTVYLPRRESIQACRAVREGGQRQAREQRTGTQGPNGTRIEHIRACCTRHPALKAAMCASSALVKLASSLLTTPCSTLVIAGLGKPRCVSALRQLKVKPPVERIS